MRNYFSAALCLTALILGFAACDNAPQMPKPSTYMRLEVLPAKFITFNQSQYPFTFEYSSAAQTEFLDSPSSIAKWFNLHYTKYNFTVNVSWIKLTADTSLYASVNDCYTFLKRHEKLSGGIVQRDYQNPGKHLYGTVFEIKGRDVVSPYQFYLTDSLHNFVRVALNCDIVPNNDSCAVVVEQIKKDLQHMINTFEWKTSQ
ncbi:MAG: hypothetical protein IJ250_07245 [Bacteroidales bacterium]|nr:hypothetical protein [Bacteroidales bacterium]